MNILGNKYRKETSILLNSVIYLCEKHNTSIDKHKLFKEFEEGSLVLSLNDKDNTLHIYSKHDSDFNITIPNTTANKLKSVRAVGLLRYSVDSINK